MSKMIPVKNNSQMPMYVGSFQIAAGETRHFPEHQVPAYLREPEQAEEVVIGNPLALILNNSIKKIVPQLPALSDDQLTDLEEIEANYENRTGIAKAIQEERLRRADLALDAGDNAGEDNNAGENEGAGDDA